MSHRDNVSIGSFVLAKDSEDSIKGHVMGIERDEGNNPLTLLVQDPVSEKTKFFNLFDFSVDVKLLNPLFN